MDWIKGSGAVIADEHGSAPAVSLGEHLRTATAAALSIQLADEVITEVFLAIFMTWFQPICFVRTLASTVLIIISGSLCLSQYLKDQVL